MYFCSRIGKIVHFLYFFMDKNFIFCYNKSMISFFDVENLNVFLQNFYTAVGIRISVFDDEFRLVCEYPKEPPRYCALIRSTKGGPSACRNCDVAAFQKTKEMINQIHLNQIEQMIINQLIMKQYNYLINQ